jgi:hypothetical protein
MNIPRKAALVLLSITSWEKQGDERLLYEVGRFCGVEKVMELTLMTLYLALHPEGVLPGFTFWGGAKKLGW